MVGLSLSFSVGRPLSANRCAKRAIKSDREQETNVNVLTDNPMGFPSKRRYTSRTFPAKRPEREQARQSRKQWHDKSGSRVDNLKWDHIFCRVVEPSFEPEVKE
jgi:hypothetical protein